MHVEKLPETAIQRQILLSGLTKLYFELCQTFCYAFREYHHIIRHPLKSKLLRASRHNSRSKEEISFHRVRRLVTIYAELYEDGDILNHRAQRSDEPRKVSEEIFLVG